MLTDVLPGRSGAIFSPDRTHRYLLWRVWDSGLPLDMWLCHRPSSGDEKADTGLIPRILGYYKKDNWGQAGVGGFMVVAANPLLEEKPADTPDDSTYDNAAFIRWAAERAGRILIAWGGEISREDELRTLGLLMPRLHCVGLDAEGSPTVPARSCYTDGPLEYLLDGSHFFKA